MSQALYRRYRPETFTEVIGQEHVTEPLMQALRAGKITHAYLFSGPRGCGKTTSARILARCLNCAEGPTPTPCGTCDSCRELGRGGPGSLDVVEIDAASHNGVDDARDLRERAAYAPARDRYKIFILDEAHMVTPQGFNALLKIVEEPPPHVKFIFATTEPDKVIGTIRSRTHHYPFRLVAPDTLAPYLDQMCAAEGVPVGSGVLPLVVRAGGGSVRDSLSVLDQLIAGSDAEGLDYERAVALLGYTHAALLDDTVDAIAARDGASAFRVVDRVISSGHEPRRFVEDVLERLRDLIVIAASGDAAQAVLRDLPADQLERMRVQARTLGMAELSRAADLTNAALSEMTGATSPRLHLELLAARLLLPAVDDSGVVARLERVERLVDGASIAARVERPTPATAPVVPDAAPSRGVVPPAAATTSPSPVADRAADPPPASVEAPAAPARVSPAPAASAPAPAVETRAEVARTPAAVPAPPPDVPAERQAPSPAHVEAAPEGEMVRRRWPEVLASLRGVRRSTWVLVSENAQVASVSADAVSLAFTTPQLATTFRTGPHGEHVRRALRDTLGLDVRVESVIAPAGAGASAPTEVETARADRSSPAPGTPSKAQAEASWGAPSAGPSAAAPSPARGAGSDDPPASSAPTTPPAAPVAADPSPSAGQGASEQTPVDPIASDGIPDGAEPDLEAADGPDENPAPRRGPAPSVQRGSTKVTAPAPVQARAQRTPPAPRPPEASAVVGSGPLARHGVTVPERTLVAASSDGSDASPDDPELASSGLIGAPLVAQMLGGTVIDEIPDPPT